MPGRPDGPGGEAAAKAFKAGLDIELPADECAAHLGEAVRRGLLSIETVDAIVRRILTEKLLLGLFEKPYVDEEAIELQTPATVELAREHLRAAARGEGRGSVDEQAKGGRFRRRARHGAV